MPGDEVAPARRMRSTGDWAILITPSAFVGWFVLMLGFMIKDQLSYLPPRPPTKADLIRYTPIARAKWHIVFKQLQKQLELWQPKPPPLGAVWSTRNGRICGVVDDWHTGVDVMTPFYTVGDHVLFKDNDANDLRQYVAIWPRCLMDPWVVLHQGSLVEGACAAPPNREFCSRR